MNLSGPAVPIRLVIENPYFFAIPVLVPTPRRPAMVSSRLTPAGPGTPIRTGRSMPRSRTASSHFSTGSTSKPNCVMTTPGSPSWDSVAALPSSALQSADSGIAGCPSG